MPKKPPKLHVMFDTNVLFTQVASDLVRHEVRHIIEENSKHLDLEIEWHLPEVVIGERKFQMLKKANELLPNMQKLERLLGHKLGVGEDTLELHVDKAIANCIKEHGFQVTSVDTNEIDWSDLISRSVKRAPPFEANEKEKGFRDSIIAHSFIQMHKNSPATANVCRLALITEDQRLKEYVLEQTGNSKNIRMLSSLDELESLINTLVSAIPEEFAIELSQKASKLFFEKGNSKSFYYKEKLQVKLQDQYSKELDESPLSDSLKESKTWWISEPIFIKKEKQLIYWTTIVEPEFEIYHYEYTGNHQNSKSLAFDSLSQAANILRLEHPVRNPLLIQPGTGQGLLSRASSQKKVVDLTGRDRFEVSWSANLSQAKNLTAPKLLKIQYLGNDLADGDS